MRPFANSLSRWYIKSSQRSQICVTACFTVFSINRGVEEDAHALSWNRCLQSVGQPVHHLPLKSGNSALILHSLCSRLSCEIHTQHCNIPVDYHRIIKLRSRSRMFKVWRNWRAEVEYRRRSAGLPFTYAVPGANGPPVVALWSDTCEETLPSSSSSRAFVHGRPPSQARFLPPPFLLLLLLLLSFFLSFLLPSPFRSHFSW